MVKITARFKNPHFAADVSHPKKNLNLHDVESLAESSAPTAPFASRPCQLVLVYFEYR